MIASTSACTPHRTLRPTCSAASQPAAGSRRALGGLLRRLAKKEGTAAPATPQQGASTKQEAEAPSSPWPRKKGQDPAPAPSSPWPRKKGQEGEAAPSSPWPRKNVQEGEAAPSSPWPRNRVLDDLGVLANKLLMNAASWRVVRGQTQCVSCRGTGRTTCGACQGAGIIKREELVRMNQVKHAAGKLQVMLGINDSKMRDNDWMKSNRCKRCKGTGALTCVACDGSGVLGPAGR